MKLNFPYFLVLGNTMCDDGDDARMSLPPTMAIAKSNLVLKSFGKAAKFHFLTLGRKYLLHGYILGMLTHTTAWDQHWGGDEITEVSSNTSSLASPCLIMYCT